MYRESELRSSSSFRIMNTKNESEHYRPDETLEVKAILNFNLI